MLYSPLLNPMRQRLALQRRIKSFLIMQVLALLLLRLQRLAVPLPMLYPVFSLPPSECSPHTARTVAG